MSTEFTVTPNLYVIEQSSLFTMTASSPHGIKTDAGFAVHMPEPLTAEQLISAALRMIHPALYHVDDVADTKVQLIAAVAAMVA